jgi:hypothetical protein
VRVSDDALFWKHDLILVVENQQKTMVGELDGMSDDRLLNTDLAALEEYCFDKYKLDLPELGEPQVDTGRTKMTVGRYGDFNFDNGSFEVDAERFTLEIPYTGDRDLFFCRGSTFNYSPPHGTVSGSMLSTTIVERDPSTDRLNQQFDKFLEDIRQHIGWLKPLVDGWNERLKGVVREHVSHRRARLEKSSSVAAGLKFSLKSRGDAAATFSAPVSRKRIAPVLPPAKPGAAPEPVLTPEAYRDILDTLQQMSEVMERSPHAYAGMDEETLRFQFLVPLNAKFEGEARGEVFNYGGKTDIQITYKGKNIFIAECKIWRGAAALTEAIDQLLGYLSWRDTKTSLLVFNRNKGFSTVLAQIDPTVRAHPNFVKADGTRGETEFRYTFSHRDDPERRLTVAVLAFDIPAEAPSD